jgi:GT2 family glycosyltransferase
MLRAVSNPAHPEAYVAGVIHHADWDQLPGCLEGLRRQTRPPAAVLVVDTGVDPARLEPVRRAFPEVVFEVGTNRGWGAGVNRALAWAAERHPEAAHLLLLNPDAAPEPDYAERLVEDARAHPEAAILGGKLLRPDRATLDSAGIRLPRHRRPRDRGSGEPDRGRWDRRESVFAVSGAAMLVRLSAMEDLAIAGEVVDEDFFAYHDDTDLCWRARRFGWDVVYQPTAVAIHARGWRRERRFEIDAAVRRHSFKNHYLQIIKNERGADLLRNLPWLLAWEVLRLGFALLRDPAVLPGYAEAVRGAPAAWAKRRTMAERLAREPRRADPGGRACYKVGR